MGHVVAAVTPVRGLGVCGMVPCAFRSRPAGRGWFLVLSHCGAGGGREWLVLWDRDARSQEVNGRTGIASSEGGLTWG